MIEMIFDSLWALTVMSAIYYAFIHYTLKRYCFGFLDPMGVLKLLVTVSLVDLTILFLNDYLKQDEFLKMITLTAIFLFFTWVPSLFFSKQNFKQGINDLLIRTNLNDDQAVFKFTLATALILNVIFSLLLLGAESGDYRIVLAKQFRLLDVLKNGFTNVALTYGFLLVVFTNNKRILFQLILFAFTLFFTGAKSFVLTIVVTYFFFYGIHNYENFLPKRFLKSVKEKLVVGILGVVIILSGFLTLWYWRGDPSVAWDILLSRVFLAGDIYLYAYVWGDYTQLYEKYNIGLYFLHPFLKLLGLQGYDFPLGAELFGLTGQPIEGFGPNAQLPILVAVLTHGNTELAFFVMSLLGLLYGASFVVIQKMMVKNFPAILIYYLIAIYLWCLPTFYLDIGVTQQTLISLTITFAMIIFVKKLMEIINIKTEKI